MANTTRRGQSGMQQGYGSPFEELLQNFFSLGRFGGRGMRRETFVPRLEVQEKDDAYWLCAELPGMKDDDVEVQIDGNLLTIRGEKKQEETRTEGGYSYSERSYGQFLRSL